MRVIKSAAVIFVTGITLVGFFGTAHATNINLDTGTNIRNNSKLKVEYIDNYYDTEGFSDVTTDDWYYTDIMDLARNGYVFGYGNGEFRPNRSITVNELVTIICRQSKFSNTIVSSNNADYSFLFAKGQGWVPSNLKADSILNREQALHIILAGTGVASWYQDTPNFKDSFEIGNDYINDFGAGIGLGIVNGSNNLLHPKDYVTRAEVCAMFSRALNNVCDVYAPVEFSDMHIEYDGDDIEWLSWAYRKAIGDIPESLVNRFIDEGWKLVFTDNMGKYHKADNAVGLTSYSNKAIYIEVGRNLNMQSASTVYHEFGHYLLVSLADSYIENVKQAKDVEQDELATLLAREYCKTNEREYFAEAFKTFIEYKDKLVSLPLTYKVVTNALAEI